MWKYIVLNSLWFAMLFSVHFFGSKKDQRTVLFFVFVTAGVLIFRGGMDPFAWFFYLIFSLTVFHAAGPFKQWVFARAVVLDEEVKTASAKLDASLEVLTERTFETDLLTEKANQISELYDRVKEMSKSLSMRETFVLFGETLARHFEFKRIKLAVFPDEQIDSAHPQEIYELKPSDFQGLFDCATFLRDLGNTRSTPLPFDQAVFRRVFRSQERFRSLDADVEFFEEAGGDERPLFMAYPIFIHKKIFAVLTMVGIDHFKTFNDHYGHLVGDVVLRQVAETIKKNIREVDMAGRYGGEEFGILLIETDELAAYSVAERIRRSVRDRDFEAYDEKLKVTVSIGCASDSPAISEVGQLIDAADAALYLAKAEGRDRVCLHSTTML